MYQVIRCVGSLAAIQRDRMDFFPVCTSLHSVPSMCITEPHFAGKFVNLNLFRGDGKGQSRKQRFKKMNLWKHK